MNHKPTKPGYLFSTPYTNYLFILLFLLYLFDFADRMIVNSMFIHIQKDWGINNAQSGLLVSAVYWSIIVLTFPVSLLVDRWSRRKTIGIMAMMWSIATALCALTGNFTQLLFARVLVGIGEAGYAPGGTAMIAAIYPQEKRSQMLGIWTAAVPLGVAIGTALGGIIASAWGWKHAFGLVAIPGFIVAILFYFTKDYKTVKLDRQTFRAGMKTERRYVIYEFLEKPSFIFTSFGIAAVMFTTTALMTWLPKYMHVTANLPENKAGTRAGIVFLLAIIGGPLGGYITDRWRKKRMNARLLFPAITTALAAVLLFISLQLPTGMIQYAVLLSFGLTVTAFGSAAIAVTQDVVHAGLRAVSYAIAVVVQNFIGASFAPVIIGFLIDRWTITQALLVLPFVLLLGALLFFLGSKYYESDYNKVKRVELEVEE